MKDNEAIRILDVDGQLQPTPADLHRHIFLMGVSAELSKSEKGLYHAQINPAIGEDKAMTDEAWLEASDILGRQLGLTNQRRAIVLHTKNGRTHAHVVWERFDHEKQKMVSDSFSRLAQDRARKEMELVFNQKKTPHRNIHRPELKASLTQIWQHTETGAQFIKTAHENGYLIAEGSGRNPFMVVDEAGRSYNLARQITGAKLKDLRQRLRGETLLGEKDAIVQARKNAADNTGKQKGSGKQQSSSSSILKLKTMQEEFSDNKADITNNEANKEQTVNAFRQNQTDMDAQPKPQETKQQQFKANKLEATGQQPEKTTQEKFAENKADAGLDDKAKEKERKREEFRQQIKEFNEQNQKNKDKGLDLS